MNTAIRFSQVAYAWLLYLCPAEFRNDFGGEMLTVFRQDLRDSWKTSRLTGIATVWSFALREVMLAALPMQLKSNFVVASVGSLIGTSVLYAALFFLLTDKTHVRFPVPPWRH
jgi:hypothetical protein